MATLTKAVISERLYMRNPNLSKDSAKELVELFFETLKDGIVEGEDVKISGFGNFKTREKTARVGRNPKTCEPHVIAARRVCTFRAGGKLRQQCESITSFPPDVEKEPITDE